MSVWPCASVQHMELLPGSVGMRASRILCEVLGVQSTISMYAKCPTYGATIPDSDNYARGTA